jgi:formylglycine-generating enzyme required for sulfatase activity
VKAVAGVSSSAIKASPLVNSLGMKFVPAGTEGVLFSVWDTRVKDFEAFIRESGYDMSRGEKAYTWKEGNWTQAGGDWRDPHFPEPQTQDDPVVCVSLEDAKAFCAWLTTREQRSKSLPTEAHYRLPSDEEWSAAAGPSTYPWGGVLEDIYPPPKGAGNFDGAEDGFARTSPVGRFAPNQYGLYDMGGNVRQWCDTPYQASMNSAESPERFPWMKNEKASDGTAFRVLRGASWSLGDAILLRTSCRGSDHPARRHDNRGFRCVLVTAGR